MKVFKYDVPLQDGIFAVSMPQGAEVMSCQLQFGEPRIWALVDSTSPLEKRYFCWVGIGHELPTKIKTFGRTLQVHGGSLVFHLFEVEAS